VVAVFRYPAACCGELHLRLGNARLALASRKMKNAKNKNPKKTKQNPVKVESRDSGFDSDMNPTPFWRLLIIGFAEYVRSSV